MIAAEKQLRVAQHPTRTALIELSIAAGFFILYQASETLIAIRTSGIILSLIGLTLTTGLLIFLDRRLAAPTLKGLHRSHIRLIVGGVVSAWVFNVVAGMAANLLTPHVATPENQQTIINIADHRRPLAVWVFIVGAFIAPVIEELIFRRFLIGTKNQKKALWVTRIILSIVLFELAHSLFDIADVFSHPETRTIISLIVGGSSYLYLSVVFAWLYVKTGNLSVPLATHVINNTAALSFALFLAF